MNNLNEELLNNFYEAILELEDVEECRAFFEDVCTINELKDLSSRLEVARLLKEGKVFNEIIKITGASSATIGRVNKCLRYGPGGYKSILEKLEKKER